MTQLLYLDYVALIIYILMLVAWFLRTRNQSGQRSIYLVMLIIALITDIFDIFSISTNSEDFWYIELKYLFHCGYLIFRNYISVIYFVYIISVTDTWHKIRESRLLKLLLAGPFAIVLLLIVSSPITHFIFYLNDHGLYVRGPGFLILYAVGFFYLVEYVCYSIKYRHLLRAERYIPMLSIMPSQILAAVIQLFMPNIVCEMFATSLCLLFVMITIEKPEEKIDNVTGLRKSNAFYEMIVKSDEIKRPYCAVIVNLTNFPALSSYLSHSAINTLFSAVGLRLETVSMHLDIKSEIYDLENGLFAAVFYGDDIPMGARFANHAFESLSREYSIGELTISVLPSVCVVKYPIDTDSLDQLRLLFLDIRHLKYTGDISLASSFMKNKDYSVMANMDSILNSAIENDMFEVYYQPIYSIKENRFNSAEALIRLNTKEHGFIRPDLFIPMAEESGAIHKIGMIVLEKVCGFISSEEYKKLNIDYIEVNLSVVQCMDRLLTDKITSVCEKYGVSPSQINFEITETASSFTQKNMMLNITKLHELGFSFSLDDFGTGYSNMVRIASLPLHIVKLDRSFTWTENNDDLKLILENTINMIKKMNMKIVVEGVETEDMLIRFKAMGCEYIQGYYFSKPLPEFDFIQFINDKSVT